MIGSVIVIILILAKDNVTKLKKLKSCSGVRESYVKRARKCE